MVRRIAQHKTLLVLIFSLFGCSDLEDYNRDATATLVDEDGATYLAHEVIFMPSAEATVEARQQIYESLGARVISENSPLSIELGYIHLELPSNINANEAINELLQSGIADTVDKNYVMELDEEPNDPRWTNGHLWGLDSISAQQAWNLTTGSHEVVVAVLDTGMDYNHQDLRENMWSNSFEIPGNGIDDDANGFVDDIQGWNAASLRNQVPANDPMDIGSHGTHVGGTIGAVGNNNTGVVGVNWQVSLMPINVFHPTQSGRLSGTATDVINGIKYAANTGARVLNASLGHPGSASYVVSAIRSFQDQGGIFIASAGNAALNVDQNDYSPCNVDVETIVCVAALYYNQTANQHELIDARHTGGAWGSNYGLTTVDIAAPGAVVLSTTPGNAYGSKWGTSMAAPHVAGAAALFLSMYPEATPIEVKEALLSSGDDLGELASKTITGKKLNVFRMINDHIPPPVTPENFAGETGISRNISLSWTQPESETLAVSYLISWGTSSGNYTHSVSIDASELTTEIENLIHDATYYFVIQAVAERGQKSTPSPEVSVTAQDGTAPASIIDLVATSFEGSIQESTVLDSSGQVSDYWSADNVADGDPATAWFVAPTQTNQEQYIVLQLAETTQLEQVELLPSAIYPDFFPVDYDVEVSADGISFAAVGFGREVTASANQWKQISFEPRPARYVRLKITQSHQHESGLFYTGLAEIRARGVSEEGARVRLRFTAPGDDPGRGHADNYRIYVANGRNGDNLVGVSLMDLTHTPLESGLLEDIITPELEPETTYHFQISAVDAAGNISGLSNIATASTRLMPPAPINDLAVVSTTPSSVRLRFSQTGQNGTVGLASSYDVRFSASPITAGNFYQASQATDQVGLADNGQLQINITGLTENQVYYFAVKGIDVHGLAGSISNVVNAIPQNAVDTTPPATLDDLVAWPVVAYQASNATLASASTSLSGLSGANNIIDGVASTDWRITSSEADADEFVSIDLGASLPLDRIRLYRSTQAGAHASFPLGLKVEVSADHANWFTVVTAQPVVLPDTVFVEYELPATHARYIKLNVTQLAATPPGSASAYYSHIAEMEVMVREPATFDVDLTWIAPGDDDWFGTATTYELYHATHAINDDNYDGNSVEALTIAAPAPGGMIEVASALNLGFETTHYFALRTLDEAGNASGLSNNATVVAPPLPPAPITDLRVAFPETQVTKTSVTLTMTATGDDGYLGNPTSIDVRYSTQPINWENWDTSTAAFLLHDPAISPGPTHAASAATTIIPFSNIEIDIQNLDPSTEYYFAARTWDNAGNGGILSNIAQATTLDGIAPGAITNLSATFADPTTAPPQTLFSGTASQSVGDNYLADHLLDDNADTDWMTSENNPYFEMNLESPIRLGKARFLFSTLYWDLTPSGIKIFVRESADNPWTQVAGDDVVEYEADWQEWAVGSVLTSQIRVEFESCAGCNDLVALAGFEAYEDPSDFTTIELMWTAPGDDGHEDGGQASSYDLRRSNSAIESQTDFDNAGYRYTEDPEFTNQQPLAAGFLERFSARELAEETEYCFALTATDELNNTSEISNSACAFTRGTPPSTVFDLEVTEGSVTSDGVTLTFSAPTVSAQAASAAEYSVCYQEVRITTGNWDNCAFVENTPTPQASGTETIEVTGLVGATRYYFAVRSLDVGGNWSAISNNARATTEDDIPPSRVTDLIAIGDTVVPGTVELHWSTPSDDQADETLTAYDLRWRVGEPLSDSNWNDGFTLAMAVPPVPAAPGSTESHVITGVPRDAQVYFGIRSSDSDGNWSQVSNSPVATTAAESPERVIDLTAEQGLNPLSVSLIFTAPAANDTPGHIPQLDGTATAYDIRYSTQPIGNENNFYNEARTTPFIPTNPIVPLSPGASESITLDGLESETLYYFALVVVDEWGRTSYVSNTVNFTTTDVNAPDAPSNLSVEPGAVAGALKLSWTASADDGSDPVSGKVHHYDIFASPTAWNSAPIEEECVDPCAHLTLGSNLSDPQTPDVFTYSGLTGELLYYIAMRACDEAGNCSDYVYDDSMSAGYPPEAIDDLSISEPNAPINNLSTVLMTWSAPQDTGAGGIIQSAASYAFGYSLMPIVTNAQFNDPGHTTIHSPAVPITPGDPGAAQSTSIAGLQTGVTYYFAIVSYDESGRASTVSAVPYSTIDITAPDPVGDFTATTASGLGSILLSWTPPGDDGDVGSIASIELYSSSSPTTGETCLQAGSACTNHTISNPAASSRTITALPDESMIYFALRACDEADNCSPFSYAQARTMDRAPSAAAVSFVEGSHTVSSFQVQFTAPGDDANLGTPAEYFFYVSSETITASNIGDANDIRITSSDPLSAGETVILTVTGLSANNTYYVAGFARDDRGNDGDMSNVLEAHSLDTINPGMVVDLQASAGTGTGKIELVWTATGDEGNTGTADRYIIRYSNDAPIASESDWDNATTWTGSTPVARESGLPMSATLIGLQHETPYHIAVRAIDEDDNLGGIGNSVEAYTESIPPSRINSLSASVLGVNVTLNWIAPGDDGNSGDPVAFYDLRRSTSPISEESFNDAESVAFAPNFNPASPGENETITVTCPEESTVYYFAIKAIDNFGAIGPMSNTATVTTDDLTAPGIPSNLTATNVSDTQGSIPVETVTASSVLGPGWSANNAVDGSSTSPWASEGSESPQTETLILDLGSVQSIDRISLQPDGLYTTLFPTDFDLLVSENGSNWTTVVSETDFSTIDDNPIAWGFATQTARYVQLASYNSGSISTPEGAQMYYVLLAEMQAYFAAQTQASIQLTWMTPGDDHDEGTASQYEIFYSLASFSEGTLNTATALSGAPTPLEAGSLQTLVIESLPGESTYYFAMRATDEAGNTGSLSALAEVTTISIPPAPVTNLIATSASSTSVTLSFAPSNDDGTQGAAATAYEIRYNQGMLSSNNFAEADQVESELDFVDGAYNVIVSNLSPGTVYRFAVKAFDEAGNASYMSSVALAQTDTGPDLIAPASIEDFRVQLAEEGRELVPAWTITTSSQHLPDFGEEHLIDGSYSTGWATEPSNTQTEQQVRIGLSEESYIDSIHLTPAPGLSNLFPKSFTLQYRASGLSSSWQDIGSFDNYSYDDAASALVVDLSQPVLASAIRVVIDEYVLADGLYYAVLGELEIYRPQLESGNAFATWTAPADVGPTGNSSSYTMTVSSCPWSLAEAQEISGLAAPRSSGYPERAELSLSSGTYCVGITSTDDAGNESDVSTFGPVVIP